MTGTVSLQQLREGGFLDAIDVHFAQFCAQAEADSDRRWVLLLVAACVSRALRSGHPCVELAALGASQAFSEQGELLGEFPSEGILRAALAESRSVTNRSDLASEQTAISTPLVLDPPGRLYMARYFEHERQLAQKLARMILEEASDLDNSGRDRRLDQYFGTEGVEPDLQRRATARALRHDLSVIAGGPGTGKTSTVVKLLSLLVEEALLAYAPTPRIMMLAPTGKAAARMAEAMSQALTRLAVSDEVRAALPQEAMTIHRALGVMSGQSTRFLRGPDRPLRADVIVVDEASMIDLGLMRHLACAIRPGARLILLGDRYQLASVEAGSVLSEICGALLERAPEHLTELSKSYRFAERSGIAAVASAVKAGDPEDALCILREGREDMQYVASGGRAPLALQPVVEHCLHHLGQALALSAPLAVLETMNGFRVLCAHRRGPFGAQALNEEIRQLLAQRGVIPESGEFYRGRPVLITQNDYSAGLANGDVGLVWPSSEGRLAVFFPGADGRTRVLSPSQLPPHETAFAMTIHKSQGSEYGEVLVILPRADSPLLTRELLYTAVTRAKEKCVLVAEEAAIRVACSRSVVRSSGLRNLLGSRIQGSRR